MLFASWICSISVVLIPRKFFFLFAFEEEKKASSSRSFVRMSEGEAATKQEVKQDAQQDAASEPEAVGEEKLKESIAEIVATGDLSTLTYKVVAAQLSEKFGPQSIAGRKPLIKSVLVEEASKVAQAEEDKQEEEEAEKEKEKKKNAEKKKKEKSKKREREEPEPEEEEEEEHKMPAKQTIDTMPTNVEIEVDISEFYRRNPSRTGRREPPKPKKEKKARDPSKPKRPGKMMSLSNEMAEFMGRPKATRSEVSAKIREHIKENNLKNPKNGKEILLSTDPALSKLWKNKKTTWFKVSFSLSFRFFSPLFQNNRSIGSSLITSSTRLM